MRSARSVNAVVTGLSLLVSLAIGEVVLRGFVTLPLRRVLPEVRYAPHPVRRFTLLPDQVAFSYAAPARIDGRGFRVNGEAPPAPGERRVVLALGDSFTFGLGVRDEETWPAQLEQRVSEALQHPVEVVNAGTISYGVFQELDLLRTTGLATRPRIVVHALYWNDFMNAGPPPPGARPVVDGNGYFTWDQLSPPRGTIGRLTPLATSSSALLFSVRQAASALRRSGEALSEYGAVYKRFLSTGLTEQDWRPIEHFYWELRRLGEERDFAPFAVILPVSDLVTLDAPRTHAYPIAAREMLGRLGIPFLDAFALWSELRDRSEYFLPEAADAHLNPAGYRLVAGALAKALLDDPLLRGRLQP